MNRIKSALQFFMLFNCLFVAPAFAIAPVTVAEVNKAPLTSEIAVNGTLYGKDDVTLTAGISGRLMYVAEPGSEINKNDILARMDTLPLELDKARQEEMLNRANINLRLYQQDLTRLKELAKSSSAALSQVDEVQNKHDLARSDIALANVELRVIEDKLTRATIRAPFTGVVSERFKRAGREINRADELLTLLDIHHLEVRLYVPVKYLKYLQTGITLPITSGDLSQPDTASAIITAVIPSTDPRSQTVEIPANLQTDNQHAWAIGQLVDVTVPLRTKNDVLLVNRDALIIRKQGTHVVKIDGQHKAIQIPVTVGSGKGELVAISPLADNSLNAGDKIAIRGAERLQTGQEVDVQSK
ncbi:efflux RND transporter periplasmic adaptor subunit [Pseudoalteromonas prydzensis]|uniref:efflux RND transporter periplasmic adaptor subunit n=1 Tax=Pseudoalteromonas prydzensis TaxID=182141 RepID=UPI0024BD56B1|nr:efflux RND transporter periplasmic adaptor subunit [Pseudoalteromonas prydzensis]